MRECGHDKARLTAWLDGEAGLRADEIARTIATCASCSAHASAVKKLQARVVQQIYHDVGEVDSLNALQRIRRYESEERPIMARLHRSLEPFFLHGTLTLSQAAWLVLTALAAGILFTYHPSTTKNPIIIEALRVHDNDEAAVVSVPQAATTVIWLGAQKLRDEHVVKP